jgi:hypothetical protein
VDLSVRDLSIRGLSILGSDWMSCSVITDRLFFLPRSLLNMTEHVLHDYYGWRHFDAKRLCHYARKMVSIQVLSIVDLSVQNLSIRESKYPGSTRPRSKSIRSWFLGSGWLQIHYLYSRYLSGIHTTPSVFPSYLFLFFFPSIKPTRNTNWQWSKYLSDCNTSLLKTLSPLFSPLSRGLPV